MDTKMNKNYTLIILLALSFTACSHVYVRSFDEGRVTVCCPTNKLACSRSALNSMATEECGGHAKAISGGSMDSGVQTSYNNLNNTYSSNITRDMCVVYRCQ